MTCILFSFTQGNSILDRGFPLPIMDKQSPACLCIQWSLGNSDRKLLKRSENICDCSLFISYNHTSFSSSLDYSIDLHQQSHGHNSRTFIINQQKGIFNKNQTDKNKNKLYSTKPKDLMLVFWLGIKALYTNKKQKHCTTCSTGAG